MCYTSYTLGLVNQILPKSKRVGSLKAEQLAFNQHGKGSIPFRPTNLS